MDDVEKKISFCISGRDDNYTPDFLYRLNTTLNFLADNVLLLGRSNDIEIVVVDWNSKNPLHLVLELTPGAAQITRFLKVSEKDILQCGLDLEKFYQVTAINVGMRRANGKFIIQLGADTLFSLSSLNNLLQIIDNKRPTTFPYMLDSFVFLIPRTHIPWQFIKRRPELEQFKRYVSLNYGNWILFDRLALNSGGGAGAIMMPAKLCKEACGLDESMTKWGWNDTDLINRICIKNNWISLKQYGIFTHHMEHEPADKPLPSHSETSLYRYGQNINANTPSWGMGDIDIEEIKGVASSKCINYSKKQLKVVLDLKQGINKHQLTTKIYNILCRLSFNVLSRFQIREGELLLLLALFSDRIFPAKYLEFGAKNLYTSAIAGGLTPSLEMYAVDVWDREVSYFETTETIAKEQYFAGHRGYVKFINGSSSLAFENLKKSFIGEDANFDLVLYRQQNDSLEEGIVLIKEILHTLNSNGAIIIKANSSLELENFRTIATADYSCLTLKDKKEICVLVKDCRETKPQEIKLKNLVWKIIIARILIANTLVMLKRGFKRFKLIISHNKYPKLV